MGKPRKLWSQLAQSTRDRYTKAGVSARQYNSGNISPEQKRTAQRKKSAGEVKRPKTPAGQVFTSKARGKTKPFSQLSAERQRSDIRRVMSVTGASEKDARKLLINAHRKGEVLRFSHGLGPQQLPSNDIGRAFSNQQAQAFRRLSPSQRSDLARRWANIRYGNVLYFDLETVPDWPYPELDADAWTAYKEGSA